MAAEMQLVDTPQGPVEVKFKLPAGGQAVALALFVHGMSSEPGTIWEWTKLAQELKMRKTASVYPNLHSNERTAPKKGSPGDVAEALQAVAAWAQAQLAAGGSSAPPVMVFGKSWGGAQAIELSARLAMGGSPAAGLCLACPSTAVQDLSAKVAALPHPVLLVWAKDDSVIPFDAHEPLLKELKARPKGPTIFAPVQAGGHNVAKMAELDEGLAAKLAEWPDLVLGPLASLC